MKHALTWVWLRLRRKHIRYSRLTQSVKVREMYLWHGGWIE